MNSDRLNQAESQSRPAADTNPAAVHTDDRAPGTSLNGSHPVALVDLNVPQLADACRLLEQCQERYDKLSGICATMRGFVLLEVKRKLAHGHFLPWLADNFGKTRKTAAQDMRVARECGKSRPRVTFETLGRDLASTIKELENAQVDLEHPLVREIAGWVDGRTRYQLLLDYPAEMGGDTSKHPRKARSTEEELHDETLEAWMRMVDELQARTFGTALYKVEWDRLATRELAELDDRIYRVHQQLSDTLEARKQS